ncbi:hypothetical protein EV44_g6409 [Erysiphe necator]|uniref:Uncharacterized protein n=1 Tax=Uncinula necator TaxID=52586 RepID=A0A0B1P4J9_UNCNE|nr:hypothetical protein EV44_g6409 [Erysiphe necator]
MSNSIHKSSYRKAKPITNDIHRHCHILFDEGLYINALDFLNNIVTTGTATPIATTESENYDTISVFTPNPFHIELASILLIHPRYTNQAIFNEGYSEIASRSLNFLRNILHILGPIHANLVEAFSFSIITKSNNILRDKKYNFIVDEGDEVYLNEDNLEEKKDLDLKCFIANQGRTSKCAKDFWHVVGWSFNCSVRYPKRWKYLKIWLEYMLDVLEADFRERERLESLGSSGKGSKETQDSQLLTQSIISCFLSNSRGNSTIPRRIVKSIFANGDEDSLRTFPQIFPDENKISKFSDRQQFNVCKSQIFNEVFENEPNEFDMLSSFKLEKEEENKNLEANNTSGSWMGSSEAIILRQRLITLLSMVAKSFPKNFIELNDLLFLLYDYIRPLPIPIFTLFISSSKSSCLSETLYISLCQLILSRLLPKSAPSPNAVIANVDFDDPRFFLVFQKCYLPFAAFTSISHDNALVSIILENLLRLLLRKHKNPYTHNLERALEDGIAAREEGIRQHRKRRGGITTNCTIDIDGVLLKASSFRLRNLLTWLNETNEKKPGKK